jgi:hypothetical protein
MRPSIALLPEDGAAGAFGAALTPRRAINAERALAIAALVVISVAYFYAAISRSISDHFWMDEVLAVSAAGQPSLAGVRHAIWSGTDFSPPAYHYLLHFFVNAVGAPTSRLVWRIPSILAVYGAALCVYAMLARAGLSGISAALGAGIVAAFGLFDFAIQVREYALLAFALAAALLLWLTIESSRGEKAKAFLLWLVLSFCLCLHFYGCIEVAVIGIAELIYAVARRRLRTSVWLALVLTAPVEAALYPLAVHLATFNNAATAASGYYAKPTLEAFGIAIFQVVVGDRRGALLLLTLVLMALGAYIAGRSQRTQPKAARQDDPITGARSRLEIATIALFLLPFLAFAFSLLITKSFSARYMAAGALLPAILVPCVIDRLPWRQITAAALVPLVATMLVLRAHAHDPLDDVLAVLQQPRPAAPVVVGEGLLYIELMQAADPATRAELVYLRRPPGSFSPDPTNDSAVVRLATLEPEYRVSEPTDFLRDHRRFFLLSRPGGSTDTTTPYLIRSGAVGSPAYTKDGVVLFQSTGFDAALHRSGYRTLSRN